MVPNFFVLPISIIYVSTMVLHTIIHYIYKQISVCIENRILISKLILYLRFNTYISAIINHSLTRITHTEKMKQLSNCKIEIPKCFCSIFHNYQHLYIENTKILEVLPNNKEKKKERN